MNARLPLDFDLRYLELPDDMYERVLPIPHGSHHLVHANPGAFERLGLDPALADDPAFVALCAGHQLPRGAKPIATVYAGHQFGGWVPQLGDGRALLLGELRDPHGERWEVQLKGAGPTPFSRMGDGRAVLRSTIREYLCSEAMAGLGIPSTQALAIIGSDGPVYRETLETGAILVRLAPTHIRFGHFEYYAHSGRHERLAQLADFVIEHHLPELAERPKPERYLGLYEHAVDCTARLLAAWQAVGFAHGVMNTDNMSILGLTIDYGPFGFLDGYYPGFICNHSDAAGRYAFKRQPQIGWWNLACLEAALSPLAPREAMRPLLDSYGDRFEACYFDLLRAKLGLREARAEDPELIIAFLDLLAAYRNDYTQTWRLLANFRRDADNTVLLDHFVDRERCAAWAARYAERLRAEDSDDAERAARMNRVNPKYVLRNWLAQRAIERAQEGDYAEIDRLLHILRTPCDEHPEAADCDAPPPDWARDIEVSCSS